MHRLLKIALAVTAASFAASALAQVPLSNPNLQLVTNGTVMAVAPLADGSMVVGGNFSLVNGTPRANLAKFLSNGTLDPNWNPTADRTVLALAADASGNVYAGGLFSNIGGQAHGAVAKMSGSGTGAVDATWSPNVAGQVSALAVDSNGAVFVGGYFATVNGVPRANLAKLAGAGAGSPYAAFDPSTDGGVFALAADGSGHVYVGGGFTKVSNVTRMHLARLTTGGNGAPDAGWNPVADTSVFALALDANSNVYAGGTFSLVGGAAHSRVVKLAAANGAPDAAWLPTPNGSVQALAVAANNDVFIGGYFANVSGQPRIRLARLTAASGAVDASWAPTANDTVFALGTNAAGNVYAGGVFTTVAQQSSSALAVLAANSGNVAVGTAVESAGSVSAVLRQADGGVIVGGSFLRADSTPRSNLLRLRADGTLDANWNPSADRSVLALAQDAAGNVYAGGNFAQIGGSARSHVAKLSGSGTGAVDAQWAPVVDGPVYALAVDDSGMAYIGGAFANIGATARSSIARLSIATGAVDMTWNPSAQNGGVNALAVDPAGDVYAGGDFSAIGGQARSGLAKLSGATGNATPGWAPTTDGQVYALAVDSGGNIYVGGTFRNMAGQPRDRIAKLAGLNASAASWNPGADDFVNAIALDNAGNVYAGGNFTSFGGQAREHLAKAAASTGIVDSTWNPLLSWVRVSALAIDNDGYLYAGGTWTFAAAPSRGGLAELPTQFDRLFADGFQ